MINAVQMGTSGYSTWIARKEDLGITKILWAEDDDDDFYMFNAAILSIDSSIDVLRTRNGVMFSSIIQTDIEPNLIFLDINMPFRSGLHALQEVRANPRLTSVKIIMYSTSKSKAHIHECYANGADFYLVKPCTYSDILLQFKQLFNHECFLNGQRPSVEQFVINMD